jgi:hypothetical protein
MIQVTFTPGNSAQADLVGKLMAQYLALDTPAAEAAEAPGLIAAAQEEAAAPLVKRVRRTPPPAAESPAPEAPAASTASSPEPELSLETVRAKLTEVSKAGKAAEVKALLAALGVANLTAVPKEAYAQLMADAAAL